MSLDTILVTGATGKTGRRVARLLTEQGRQVRAASRSSADLFDWSDRTSWEPALKDVTAMYLVSPELGSAQAAEDIAAFTRQARAQGVRRAVLLSIPDSAGPGQKHTLAAEGALKRAGLDWTVLRVRWFFQNFSEDFLHEPVLSGRLSLPAGDGREAFVDADDIAAVVAAALTEDRHNRQMYELTGPNLMSFGDATDEIARATGRDVRYIPVTVEAYADEQRALGVPEDWVQVSTDLYEQIRLGGLSTVTDNVQKVLGRPPRNFRQYAEATAAQGVWDV